MVNTRVLRAHTNDDALARHKDLVAQGLLERVRRLRLGHCLSFCRIDSHPVRLFLKGGISRLGLRVDTPDQQHHPTGVEVL
jgi:hypothetical protein